MQSMKSMRANKNFHQKLVLYSDFNFRFHFPLAHLSILLFASSYFTSWWFSKTNEGIKWVNLLSWYYHCTYFTFSSAFLQDKHRIHVCRNGLLARLHDKVKSWYESAMQNGSSLHVKNAVLTRRPYQCLIFDKKSQAEFLRLLIICISLL